MNYMIKILPLLLLLGLFSCNNPNEKSHKDKTTGKQKSSYLDNSGGRTCEVLVVMPDTLWKTAPGKLIKEKLADQSPWLVQDEPLFDLHQIPPRYFDDVYQKFRNIFIVKIDKNFKKSGLKKGNNIYATPQTIFELRARSLTEFYQLFSDKYPILLSSFHQNELKRIETVYRGLNVDSINKKIRTQFGFSLVIPKGFYIAKTTSHFMWLRKVTPEIEEGIFLYNRPYTDTSQFNYRHLISERDSLTKMFIPGPVEASYMKVSSVFPPWHRKTKFLGRYATEIRTWWDVKGYPMGGPMLSYSFTNKQRTKLITLDGYIKAFNEDKRNLLLHLDAIFSTFSEN